MRANRLLPITALLFLGLLAAPASGQVFIDVEDRQLELMPGETSTTVVTMTNPANRSYAVQGVPTGNLSDATTLEPQRFTVGPQRQATTTLTVATPEGTDFRDGDQVLRFTLIDQSSGDTITQQLRFGMTLEFPELYLGSFDNPLPAPYQGSAWLFALEMATWAGLSLLLAALVGTAMVLIVPRSSDEIQDIMAGKVRWPIFFLPLILGGDYSWRLLVDTGWTEAVASLLDAFSILIIAVVGYRVLSAGVVHYGENFADQTDTKVDDVLVPVLEKLGAALIMAFAGFYALRALGVDFGFLLAGGLVAGLVISMAAQDTLSNFFSGLHLLLDRPFREGDVIQLESGEVCRVDRIGLRSTDLYHFQNHQEIIAPNNELATKRIVNMTYPDRHYRLLVSVGVAYETDLQEARDLLHKVAMDVDEVIKGRTTQPKVYAREFGDSSIELQLRAYVPDERDRNTATTKLIQRIHQAFQEADIKIPYPQRVIHTPPDDELPAPDSEPEGAPLDP